MRHANKNSFFLLMFFFSPFSSSLPLLLCQLLFRTAFLDRALKSAAYCRSKFGFDSGRTSHLCRVAGQQYFFPSPDLLIFFFCASVALIGCKPCNNLQCADVLLFGRLHNMLDATVQMLRLEAMDYKRELQEDIRDVLNRIATVRWL